MTKQVINHSKF